MTRRQAVIEYLRYAAPYRWWAIWLTVAIAIVVLFSVLHHVGLLTRHWAAISAGATGLLWTIAWSRYTWARLSPEERRRPAKRW